MPLPLPNTELVAQAALIYAFDALIQNADRKPTNHNCMFDGKNLVAMDFEMGFAFAREILPGAPAWEFSRAGITGRHLFQGTMFKECPQWGDFVGKVVRLNESRLAELCDGIPPTWRANEGKIFRHLLAVCDNADKLELELTRCTRAISRP